MHKYLSFFPISPEHEKNPLSLRKQVKRKKKQKKDLYS